MSVALGTQRAQRMRPIVLSSVMCVSPQYFSAISHKRHDLRKKVSEHKMCFDFLYKFVWNISHSKKKWARYY